MRRKARWKVLKHSLRYFVRKRIKPENSKNDTTGTTTSANNSTPTAVKNNTDTGNKGDAPKTGDSTEMVWLIIMTGFTGMGLLLAAKKGRRNLKGLR